MSTLSRGPLVDLGTPQAYQKEMAVLRGHGPLPYFCLDIAASEAVDIVGNGHHLPLRDASIGSIVCSHVLEHVDRPDVVIAEMHRVLRPGSGAYMTFLDMYPYHAARGVYPDYHRFKRDAIDLLLRDWSSLTVLPGGGLGQVAVNFVPRALRGAAQTIANRVDRWKPTTATSVFYVGAWR